MIATTPASAPSYTLERRRPGDLTDDELKATVELLRLGGAVDPRSAAKELPLASAVVLIKSGAVLVGVGAIKRPRPDYAHYVQARSDATFAVDSPELGYVTIAKNHTQRGLSKRIVCSLLEGVEEQLFATTDDTFMARTLSQAGFAASGHTWESQRGGPLSVWLRSSPQFTVKLGNE